MISTKSKIKNFLIKSLINLYKLFNKAKINYFDPSSPKILILTTTTIGDSLWATPSIRALKKHYPKSYIGVLVISSGHQILKNNPYIDEIYCIKEPIIFNFFDVFKKLRAQKYQICFVFHTSQRPILPLCSFLNLEKIIGTEGLNKNLDFLLDIAVKKEKSHEIIKRCNLLKEIKIDSQNYSLDLFLTDKIRNQLFETFPLNSTKPLICIHPGANDHYKCWPSKHFIELGNMIKDQIDCDLFISGSLKEKDLVEKISSQINEAVSIIGLQLETFFAFIEKMDLLITNDTGPLHIAIALKTNSAAFYTPTDPNICGPFMVDNSITITNEKSCKKCIKRKCPHPFCLEQIRPKEAYKTIFNKFNFTKYKK